MKAFVATFALVGGIVSSASAYSPVFELPRDSQNGVDFQRSFPDGSIWIELQNASEDPWLYSFQVEDKNGVIPKDQWRSNIGSVKDADEVILPPKMTLSKRYWIQFKNDGPQYICLNARNQSEEKAAMTVHTRKCRRVFVERKVQ